MLTGQNYREALVALSWHPSGFMERVGDPMQEALGVAPTSSVFGRDNEEDEFFNLRDVSWSPWRIPLFDWLFLED